MKGVIETDTGSKALANDDFGMYDQVDGMLESIVNQATATNASCSFDTRKVPQISQKDDDDYNDIDGSEYTTRVVPTEDSRRNTMDAVVVGCFNNTCSGSAEPSEINLETVLEIGAWVTDINKEEEESQVPAIQEEDDDQMLPRGHEQVGFLKEDAARIETARELHSSLGQKRGSASRLVSSTSKKGKGKGRKEAASRKHNKSEQTRRHVINQKMKTLHDLVPNHSKEASKALLLTEVIHYIKQLQAQVQTMVSMTSTVPCEVMHFPMATTNTGQMRNMD